MNNLVRDKLIAAYKLVIDNDELKLVKLCRNKIPEQFNYVSLQFENLKNSN